MTKGRHQGMNEDIEEGRKEGRKDLRHPWCVPFQKRDFALLVRVAHNVTRERVAHLLEKIVPQEGVARAVGQSHHLKRRVDSE
jgi:hypothetical protein